MPPPEDLEIAVLKKIADAKKDNKNNTRWIIIIDLAYERCVKLKTDGKSPPEIAKENCEYVAKLNELFFKLAREDKIELDLKTGVVSLKDSSEKASEEPKPKTGLP